MFAFVDESGNTGSNLFDQDQPVFLTAALITKSDFDIVHGPTIRTICEASGCNELHAADLGFGGIEPIAQEILRVLKKADAHFFISRVEKLYLLATKIFDTFFDSGENPAVPWSAYNIKPLRLILTFKVSYLLTDFIAEMFWKMLMEKSESRARSQIPLICDAIIDRLPLLPDARSRKVIGESLKWLKEHPQALDFYQTGRQAKNGHMPNMVAFTNLLDGLEILSKRWNRKVRCIRHDRQSQFEATLAEWHRMYSNASDEPIHLPGETRVMQRVRDSNFEVVASDDSSGIQIADLILWLFKQFLDGKEFPRDSARLLNFAMRRGRQSDFSFDGVGKAMTDQFGPILHSEPTEVQMKRAREWQTRIETVRQQNMAAYEVDGLMPFERRQTN